MTVDSIRSLQMHPAEWEESVSASSRPARRPRSPTGESFPGSRIESDHAHSMRQRLARGR